MLWLHLCATQRDEDLIRKAGASGSTTAIPQHRGQRWGPIPVPGTSHFCVQVITLMTIKPNQGTRYTYVRERERERGIH